MRVIAPVFHPPQLRYYLNCEREEVEKRGQAAPSRISGRATKLSKISLPRATYRTNQKSLTPVVNDRKLQPRLHRRCCAFWPTLGNTKANRRKGVKEIREKEEATSKRRRREERRAIFSTCNFTCCEHPARIRSLGSICKGNEPSRIISLHYRRLPIGHSIRPRCEFQLCMLLCDPFFQYLSLLQKPWYFTMRLETWNSPLKSIEWQELFFFFFCL